MTALQPGMPCFFCRASLPIFLQQMRDTSGMRVDDHVKRGTAFRWSFDLHNLVADKLDRQAFEDRAAKEGMSNAAIRLHIEKHLYRGKRLPFECLERRLRTRENYGLVAADVFENMQLFILQLGPGRTTSAERVGALQAYFAALADMIEICAPSYRLVEAVRDVARCATSKTAWTERDMYALVWLARYNYETPPKFRLGNFERGTLCKASYDSI